MHKHNVAMHDIVTIPCHYEKKIHPALVREEGMGRVMREC